jgi:HPt (histidine-containing phosphotransfer) domain-containing protein
VLIYNHNKELVGIDDETLHHLGYKNLGEFLQHYSDISELFVKKPGYIHNFQNFPWIDFVLHSDAEDIKAVIQNEQKHFSCNISITPIFLTDAPESQGYVIHLKHIKSLSGEPTVFEREAFPSAQPAEPTALADYDEELPFVPETPEEHTILQEPDMFDIPEIPSMELPDLNPDGSLAEPESAAPAPQPEKATKPMLGDYINREEKAFLENLQTSADYVYDPHIAADELGLPVELIEEFIGDFIQQAHDFRNDLFDAALKEDFDEVHVLSHKLKGVAANLRIEDAFEVLSIINGSRDQVEIEANLKQFYRIIAKMEGETVPDFTESEPESTPEVPLDTHEDEDIYDFGTLLQTAPEAETEAPATETGEAMPELKPETTSAEPETAALPEETVEPFERDIIPKEEQHLIEEAEEKQHYQQMSGNIATDADLPAEAGFEPLTYDIKKASAEIGLKASFIQSLIDEFINDANGKKSELMQAIADEDMKKIKAIAFEFKGLADNLRIGQISETLTKLLRNENPAAVKTEAERFYALLKQL